MKPTDIVSTALVDLQSDVDEKKIKTIYTPHMDYRKVMVLYLNDTLSPEIEYTINELAEWKSEALENFPRFFDLTARITKFLGDNGFKKYSNFLYDFHKIREKIIDILNGDIDTSLTKSEEKELCFLYARQHPTFNPLNYFDSYYEWKRDELAKMIGRTR